jgi:hypothetical protein
MHDDPLLSEIEAARYLRRHVQTIRKQRQSGTLPFPHLKVGGRFFYRRSHLDHHLNACEIPPQAAKQRA